ncbi:DNA-directed RNA polymerase subunit beta' [Qingrenia yutianensis]|uniref:DNA-directed RNA polymerase subunit beta' n=1 Tax=Qingrenia yutianensis TaxID=2763676 RepID=A0A926FCM4_9FIRM|nr:DNA-directed RNA polymerase subunit beta' [Qingrenia yutianensis]MBC8596257.1 DNA-directed RNA polymerase subunit beta' [Qingrenia yutianensis]
MCNVENHTAHTDDEANNEFEAIRIGLASPEKIREWSHGEVKKPETINYRTLKPERDGLYCERIFGPQKDWECYCGKYKRIRYKGIVCDRCGVEVTRSKVRRERMGHIELAAPVSHIWYFKGIPSRMGLILDMSPRNLEKILYFASYVVINPGKTNLVEKQVLSEKEYRDTVEKYGKDKFEAAMGAEAIKKLLCEIDLEKLSAELKNELEEAQGQKKIRVAKRLEVVEAFRISGNKPEWMIMDAVPVIPPDLRPMVQLDGGRFATSDLNDLYRRVINRNNRLKRLLELDAPEIIVRNEKRMLQEAVDALIDNGRRGRPVTGPGNRPLKSLSDLLKGKQGRFRQNLLGKRVDYSGRSVIVVGPELKIYQCGLPKEMALELFKPFVMKKLVGDGFCHNIKSAKRMVERVRPEVWDMLEDVIKDHPVLLNRAPTLHRLGIQAFEPILVEGRALKLHPLVCSAFNADFDGDQMAVHVPLSPEAQAEARFLMLSANNLLKPQDGKPVTVPTQDMVLGSYYLTITKPKKVKITDSGDSEFKVGDKVTYLTDSDTGRALVKVNAELKAQGKKEAQFTEEGCFPGEIGEGKAFSSYNEAIMAYDEGAVGLHAPIKVVVSKEIDGKTEEGIIDATVGRLIFNDNIPQDLGFVDRSKPENKFVLEISFIVDKKMLGKIVDKCIAVHDVTETANVLDRIKALGFKYSTKGAITISVSDMEIPAAKAELLDGAEKEIEKITKLFKRGLLSDDERHDALVQTWSKTVDDVTNALVDSLDEFNPIYMMAKSGARGSIDQIRQLAGMRGLMADTQGRTIEVPIKANFREGLNVQEYFISSHGARKGLTDTALRTADSGYLTRRLVDVSQDVIIREDDCGTEDYLVVKDIKDGNEIIEGFKDRLVGRTCAEDIIHPETGEVLVKRNELMDERIADKVAKAGVTEAKIRSILTCSSKIGVCAKCYGSNLSSGKLVNVGEAVGIIAAQSIGEPGTQLTMRTFHSGGIAGDDITQGLPRVEELFEARRPKGLAILTEIAGVAQIVEEKTKREVVITNQETGESVTYLIPYGSRIKITNGQVLNAGDELTEGSIYPQDLLKIPEKGADAVQQYLIQEVQRVYRLQGIDINDKHIEVIVRQMMHKVKVEDPGETDLILGSLIDKGEYLDKKAEAEEKGVAVPVVKQVLLGITKTALATESFLSAASFQETTRVLTEAAIKGKKDPLIGLKENVIIGKLIPAGTGMKVYNDIEVVTPIVQSDDINID